MSNQSLIEIENLFLIHEAHFHIELSEFRLAISAQVFISKAAGDLVVAIYACDHQNLLK